MHFMLPPNGGILSSSVLCCCNKTPGTVCCIVLKNIFLMALEVGKAMLLPLIGEEDRQESESTGEEGEI